jgi:hypothetical protein
VTDLDRLVHQLDDLPPRDVWPRVGGRGYGDVDVASSGPRGRRLVAAVTAIALGTGAIGLAFVLDRPPMDAARQEPGTLVIAAAFPGGASSLYVVTEDRTIPLHESADASLPTVSPDGRSVAYERELPRGRSALTVLRLDGSRPPRELLEVDANTGLSPTWSPDGRTIAIVNEGQIWLVPMDGTEPQVLGIDDTFPRTVTWSPDGTELAFSDSSRATMVGGCLDRGSTGIWLISKDASSSQHLTHEGCWSVTWSPTGSSLVAIGSGFDPVLVDPATGTTTGIAGTPDSAGGVPGVSADGRLIGFAAGPGEIWTYDLVTKEWRNFPIAHDLEVQGVSFLPEGAPNPGVVDEEICDFPSVRPTYLPWLAPGQLIPDPGMGLSADGGGPQGLDPGYATLSWANGDVTNPGSSPDIGAVHLWRATQSVGSFPVDPVVPPLPDGSTGKLYLSEGGGGDWSIVWGGPPPDAADDDCSETTLVVSFPNLTAAEGKEEILAIARSLVPAGTEVSDGSMSEVFVPPTYQERDLTILPLVFPDGSRAEIAYPTELRLAELGVSPNILGDLGECGSDAIITRAEQHGQIYAGDQPLAISEGTSHVELWRGTEEYAPHDYLVASFGPWWFHMPCSAAVSDATVEQWASLLRGRVTSDGFLVVSGSERLRFLGPEAGPLFGPELFLDGGRDAPGFVVLSLAEACPRGIDEDRQVGYASRCVEVGDGAIRVAVQADQLGEPIDEETERFVADMIDLIEVLDIDLA